MAQHMTREAVFASLNTAQDNGYDMQGWSASDVVADLLAFEVHAELDTAENLLPHVMAWQAEQDTAAQATVEGH